MRQTLTQPLPGTVVDQRYPDEDGRPMGDTDYHRSRWSPCEYQSTKESTKEGRFIEVLEATPVANKIAIAAASI